MIFTQNIIPTPKFITRVILRSKYITGDRNKHTENPGVTLFVVGNYGDGIPEKQGEKLLLLV